MSAAEKLIVKTNDFPFNCELWEPGKERWNHPCRSLSLTSSISIEMKSFALISKAFCYGKHINSCRFINNRVLIMFLPINNCKKSECLK